MDHLNYSISVSDGQHSSPLHPHLLPLPPLFPPLQCARAAAQALTLIQNVSFYEQDTLVL